MLLQCDRAMNDAEILLGWNPTGTGENGWVCERWQMESSLLPEFPSPIVEKSLMSKSASACRDCRTPEPLATGL